MTYGIHDHKVGWVFVTFMAAILGLMVFMAGCEVKTHSHPIQAEQAPPPPPTHSWEVLLTANLRYPRSIIINTIRIDNCQYIIIADSATKTTQIIHKSDCPNHGPNGILRSANE